MGEHGDARDEATVAEPAIRGPFAGSRPERLRRLLWISGLATALLAVGLQVIDAQLRAAGGPGILALEVAGSPARASVILSEWDQEGIRWARVSLIVDVPFLLAYGTFLAALSTALGRRLRTVAAGGARSARLGDTLHRLAPWLGWSFLVAAGLDVIENVALLQVVDYNLTPWASLAQGAAAVKFGLLAAGAGFLLASLALVLGPGRRSARGSPDAGEAG